MLAGFIIFVIVYLAIGIGILIWAVRSDPYGGFIPHVWWLVILFYPFLFIRSIFKK